jgi:ArsR family metal-binding transcriptional regulator
MLLKGYKKEIFRPECNPSFTSLHCFAHLDEDIREVIPYLNTVLGGSACTEDPPSVMFQIHGRLIAVHPRKIAINALRDELEADKVLDWLREMINDAWDRRNEITPSYGVTPKPQIIKVLRLLPKSNCGECGQPTCTVFSSLVVQGAKGSGDCPKISIENRARLDEYLAQFPSVDF